jgi:tetratricopeptide (TPR) repeat protein
LLDADMIVKLSDDFIKSKNSLKKYDYYYAMQGSEDFQYRNIRLIKNTDKIQYIGDTHEYLNVPASFKSKTLDISDFFIDDIGDGSNKSNKYERDINILENNIIIEPDNVRSYFYLANSYFDIGEYQKAIDNYKIRIQKGGWFEEVSYSMYREGLCNIALKKYEKGVHKFMKAYQTNPGRMEPLYQIIRHYRIKKQYVLCNLFFKQAITIPHPPKEALFINSDIYNYKLFYEFYIFYFYLNINDKSLYDDSDIHHVFFKLLNNNFNRSNVLENYRFYCRHLDYNLEGDTLDITKYDLTMIKNDFNSSNATIFEFNNKVYFILRFVNYFFDNDWNYKYRGKEATKNYLITYENDKMENIENEKLITEKKRVIKDYEIFEGLQDIRILNFKNNLYYTGSVIYSYQDICGNYIRGSNIEYGTFDVNSGTLKGEIIKSPKKNMCEKNWALFNTNKKVYCIYKWYPITIGLILKDKLLIKLKKETPKFFKYVCGSTPGVLINNHIVFLCHIVSYSNPRYYYHLFVRVNSKDFNYVDHSYLFTFEQQPIEYCCGMILKDGLLYITYSIKDSNTKLLTINPSDIKYIN